MLDTKTKPCSKIIRINGKDYCVKVCPPAAANGSDYFARPGHWERRDPTGKVWAPDLRWYDENLY